MVAPARLGLPCGEPQSLRRPGPWFKTRERASFGVPQAGQKGYALRAQDKNCPEGGAAALALMNQTSDTCEVFHVARPARCHPGLPAPANATDCRSDCVQNPLLRYGGLSECGAACNVE